MNLSWLGWFAAFYFSGFGLDFMAGFAAPPIGGPQQPSALPRVINLRNGMSYLTLDRE
jgi:hypothetical protein